MEFRSIGARWQQRRRDAAIRLQAGAAVEVICDRRAAGVPPPYRFRINRLPKGMLSEEVSDKVGQRVDRLLPREMSEISVTYNAAASRFVTSEFVAVTHETKPPKGPDPVIVVFTENPALH